MHVDAIGDLESVFTDTAFFAAEGNAFDMSKGRLRVQATIINGRRRWGSRTDPEDSAQLPVKTRAAKERATLNHADLLSEPSYSLQVTICPTDEWMARRVKDW